MGDPIETKFDERSSSPTETKTALLYDMLQEAVIQGIGNCTQICNRVTNFLNTGIMPVAGWRNMLPGFSSGRSIQYDVSEGYDAYEASGNLYGEGKSEGRKLLELLTLHLKEGQHVQIQGRMVGHLHQRFQVGHVFNAIKIDGEVRFIDCYQGVSKEPWLKQAWHEPEEFLKSFKEFAISEPEQSCLDAVMDDYLIARRVSATPSTPSKSPLSSLLSSSFSFFGRPGAVSAASNTLSSATDTESDYDVSDSDVSDSDIDEPKSPLPK